MLRFRYLASDQGGKRISGKVEAASLGSAQRVLSSSGLVVISLSVDSNGLSTILDYFSNRVGLGDVSSFTRQFATMITAGITITEALSILKEQANPGMTKVVDQVLADVESGSGLAAALEKHPSVFSPVYIALIKSGETGGILDKVLLRLADNLEKQREFTGKLTTALIYPVVVVIGIFVVMAVMLIFVVPQMATIYKDFNAQLPTSTKVLLAMSDFVRGYWWLVLSGIVALVWGILVFVKTPYGQRKIDQLKLKIPVVSRLVRDMIITEFTRTLGLLVGAGVSILEALSVVAKVSGNQVFSLAIEDAGRQVEKGFPLAWALGRQEEIFPLMVARMIAVGEETGKMDEVLGKVSHILESETETRIRGLTAALEPIIMIILGLAVGFLVFSMIVPIYSLTNQIGNAQ